VEALIQPDAPVEWRVVDFSWSYLQGKAETELTPFIEKHGITQAAGWGVDVGSDRLFVETRGPQPDLVAALQRQFGDLVVIRVGMG